MEKLVSTVLVTGATGFLAAHVVKVLLENNYKVRGTVRSLKDEKKYEHLKKLVPEKNHNLELVEADLLIPSSWDNAAKGVQAIMHVASPNPSKPPKDEMDVIRPAVEGTLNILQAALKNKVRKVVLTSSLASVIYGNDTKICTEEDWSIEKNCGPYEKSKLRAEKAAWEFWNQNKDQFELVVLNPGFILGPTFSKNEFTSAGIVVKFFNNQMPGIPRMSFPVVDVRDVALAQVRALESKDSNGKRYILAANTLWLEDFVNIFREEFSKYGYKFPTKKIGKCPLRIAALFDRSVKMMLPSIGKLYRVDNQRSVKEFNLSYTDIQKTLIDMGYNLVDLGFAKNKIGNLKN